MRDLEDFFKAAVTIVVGIILASAFSSLLSPEILKSFISLGVVLIILGVVMGIIWLVKILKSPYSFF